jgi:hypothetical protein
LVRIVAALAMASMLALAGCSGSAASPTPSMAPRGTTITTVKPTRQDLSNTLSLTGSVGLNPVFGIVAPVAGQVRYLDVATPTSTPTKPTRVANIVAGGKSTPVEVPAGATFAGRLVDDRSTVTVGMPIVSARYVGYGIAATVQAADAYRVAGALTPTVQAQILGGPGPFACSVLGTIAALPAGTIPAPPAADPALPANDPGAKVPPVIVPQAPAAPSGSDATGPRLVCTAPADVRLINGASVTLQVVTARAANVLVLPVEAVAGGQGTGKVDVLGPDGNRQTRDVVLGLSDGKVVEIKSGLDGTETVAIPGPNLPEPPPQNAGPK